MADRDPDEPRGAADEPWDGSGAEAAERGSAESGSGGAVSAGNGGAGKATGALDRFFKISERGSSLSRELRGGLVTFCLLYTSDAADE